MSSFIVRMSRLLGRVRPGTLLFFVLFYAYVWLRIDPSLLYFWPSAAFPAFLVGPAFLKGFLVYPGGPVEYAAAFLSQLYYYPWLGALVITAVAGLMWISARLYLSAIMGRSGRPLHFVPAVLLLMLYNRYDHALALGLACVLAVSGACLYLQSRRLGPWVGFLAFFALFGLVYYAAGGASLLYALLCGLIELGESGNAAVALSCFVTGAVVPWLARRAVFDATPAEAYLRLLPLFHARSSAGESVPICHNEVLGLCLYLSLPLVAAAAVIWRRVPRGGSGPRPEAASDVLAKLGARSGSLVRKRVWASAALFIAVAVVVWLSFDSRLNRYLALERYARLGKWERLLDKARQISAHQYDPLICYDVNRALYHTDRLPDEMFAYPQHPTGLLIPPPLLMERLRSSAFELLMRFSDILYELGRVNDAEHMAYEVFAWIGRRPMVLRRLAMINIVKEQVPAARGYLLALDKDLVYGRWARECLSRLSADPRSAGDEEVRRIRSLMPVKDDVRAVSVEVLLEQCLEANKRNRMAFEYLMGYLLLNRRLEEVVRNIARLSDFDYARIPRSYEEAILIYQVATRSQVDLHGRSISPQTLERFRGFYQILNSYLDNPAGARQALKDYGDTYFYYWMFGPGGGRT